MIYLYKTILTLILIVITIIGGGIWPFLPNIIGIYGSIAIILISIILFIKIWFIKDKITNNELNK